MFICAIVVIINLSGLPINQFDMETLEYAKVECPKRYKQSPCVRKFFKYQKRSHGVICGVAEKSKVLIESSDK